MQLREAQRPFSPVRHLFLLAQLLAWEQFNHNFSEPLLKILALQLGIVLLGVDEVGDVVEEVQLGETSLEHRVVSVVAESDDSRTFILENSFQNCIEHFALCQRYHINSKCVILAAQLQHCNRTELKLDHGRLPFGVDPNERAIIKKCLQLWNIFFRADKLSLDLCRNLEIDKFLLSLKLIFAHRCKHFLVFPPDVDLLVVVALDLVQLLLNIWIGDSGVHI